jgi:hypothetical protein
MNILNQHSSSVSKIKKKKKKKKRNDLEQLYFCTVDFYTHKNKEHI